MTTKRNSKRSLSTVANLYGQLTENNNDYKMKQICHKHEECAYTLQVSLGNC